MRKSVTTNNHNKTTPLKVYLTVFRVCPVLLLVMSHQSLFSFSEKHEVPALRCIGFAGLTRIEHENTIIDVPTLIPPHHEHRFFVLAIILPLQRIAQNASSGVHLIYGTPFWLGHQIQSINFHKGGSGYHVGWTQTIHLPSTTFPERTINSIPFGTSIPVVNVKLQY